MVTDEGEKTLAEAMNLSLQTGNRYYNFNSVNSSVVGALDMSNIEDLEGPSTSTPMKRNAQFMDGEVADNTIKTLRNEKILKHSVVSENSNELREKKIREIIGNIIDRGDEQELTTKTGNVNTQLITMTLTEASFKIFNRSQIRLWIEEEAKKILGSS